MKINKKLARIMSFVAYTLAALIIIASNFSFVVMHEKFPERSFGKYLRGVFEFIGTGLADHNINIVPPVFVFSISFVFFVVLFTRILTSKKGKELINEATCVIVVGSIATFGLLLSYKSINDSYASDCGPFHPSILWMSYIVFTIICLIFISSSLYLINRDEPKYDTRDVNVYKKANALAQRYVDEEMKAYEAMMNAKRDSIKAVVHKDELAKQEEYRIKQEQKRVAAAIMREERELSFDNNVAMWKNIRKANRIKRNSIEEAARHEERELLEQRKAIERAEFERKEMARIAKEREDERIKKIALAKKAAEQEAAEQERMVTEQKAENEARIAAAKAAKERKKYEKIQHDATTANALKAESIKEANDRLIREKKFIAEQNKEKQLEERLASKQQESLANKMNEFKNKYALTATQLKINTIKEINRDEALAEEQKKLAQKNAMEKAINEKKAAERKAKELENRRKEAELEKKKAEAMLAAKKEKELEAERKALLKVKREEQRKLSTSYKNDLAKAKAAKVTATKRKKIEAKKANVIRAENNQKAKSELRHEKAQNREQVIAKKAKTAETKRFANNVNKIKKESEIQTFKGKKPTKAKKIKKVKKVKVAKVKSSAKNVYHVIPHNNGKAWWVKKMGETKPVKSFSTKAQADSYAKNNIEGKPDTRVYYHDVDGKIEG